MKKNIICGLLGLFLLAGCTQDPLSGVSMIQLIANPEKYDGQYVRVMGFLRLEFEGNALYLHQEDYEESLSKNGVWVDVVETEANRKFNMKYVVIEGTFTSNQGHMWAWSGGIRDIKRMELWGTDRQGAQPSITTPEAYP